MILKRRIERLESRWPRRRCWRSFEELLREAANIARLTGTDFEEAFTRLIVSLSPEERDRLLAEAEAAVGPAEAAAVRQQALRNID
jgi:hypothetical protein